MLNKNAQLWVDALRSGEYKQAYEELQVGDNYCCLGVACRVYEDQTGRALDRTISGKLNGVDLRPDYNQLQECDYSQVKKWLGLRGAVGEYLCYENDLVKENTLVSLNDEKGATFTEIADVIESKPKGLFV